LIPALGSPVCAVFPPVFFLGTRVNPRTTERPFFIVSPLGSSGRQREVPNTLPPSPPIHNFAVSGQCFHPSSPCVASLCQILGHLNFRVFVVCFSPVSPLKFPPPPFSLESAPPSGRTDVFAFSASPPVGLVKDALFPCDYRGYFRIWPFFHVFLLIPIYKPS